MNTKTREPRFTLDRLISKLAELAVGVKSEALYWLNPDDSCESYCFECAVKKTEELAKETFVDGGWRGEEDSQQWCATCGVLLDCELTNYGVEEEIGGASEADSITPETAWILLHIIDCGVPRLTETCGDFTYGREHLPDLKKIWKLIR